MLHRLFAACGSEPERYLLRARRDGCHELLGSLASRFVRGVGCRKRRVPCCYRAFAAGRCILCQAFDKALCVFLGFLELRGGRARKFGLGSREDFMHVTAVCRGLFRCRLRQASREGQQFARIFHRDCLAQDFLRFGQRGLADLQIQGNQLFYACERLVRKAEQGFQAGLLCGDQLLGGRRAHHCSKGKAASARGL